MFKDDELRNKDSCLNRAQKEEMVFTLLARDICAPDAIRYWCQLRIQRGKNTVNDPQIKEALEVAQTMEGQRLTGQYIRAPFLDMRDR